MLLMLLGHRPSPIRRLRCLTDTGRYRGSQAAPATHRAAERDSPDVGSKEAKGDVEGRGGSVDTVAATAGAGSRALAGRARARLHAAGEAASGRWGQRGHRMAGRGRAGFIWRRQARQGASGTTARTDVDERVPGGSSLLLEIACQVGRAWVACRAGASRTPRRWETGLRRRARVADAGEALGSAGGDDGRRGRWDGGAEGAQGRV